AIRALKKGYHVFCEKPMALTADETDAMIAAEKASGKLFSVGQCLRFWPAYVEVKKLLDSGRYGKVQFAEFGRYSSRPGWGWNNWLLKSEMSGNAALDLHVHDVDMVLWMFGKPKSVRSSGVVEPDGGVSRISTVYGYDGKVVTSTGGWNCSDSFGFNMRAFFVLDSATIELDFSKDPAVALFPQGGKKEAVKLSDGDGYLHEIEDFVAGIEAGRTSGVVTGKSAADSVKVCLLEIQSAKENREIIVP
ncbi:MAG TPA: Gfo/Idh/MocA family oxidoreductase, partial [Spirochaetia bacterium]|nr:Gfo/Idh/MocA family oxidoreductase [Spirochaetia bacterium]